MAANLSGLSDLPVDHRPLTLAQKRIIRGAAVGQFVEWYDFLSYAALASVLAINFFPAGNPALAILSSLAIYGAGFLMRPLGGMFFGRFGDKLGRRNVLATTIILMGGATLACGVIPTYHDIGIAAPVILLLLRLIQGFSAGGEASSMGPLVLESAPETKRGYWIGLAFAASLLPSALVGFFIIWLTSMFGVEAFNSWVWRIPFLAGGVLAAVGFFIRLRIEESKEFVDLVQKQELAHSPLKETVMRHKKAMLYVFLIISGLAVGAYTIHSYMFTYLIKTAHMDQVPATLSTSIAIIFFVIFLPYCGKLADRFGRRPMMMTGALVLGAAAFPAYLLCSTGTFWGALTAQLVLTFGVSVLGGGGYVTLYELFPTNVRSSGIGLGYNLGYAIFGGSTPFVNQILVEATGYSLAPAFYQILICVVVIIAVKTVPETRGQDLTKSALDREPIREGARA